MFADDHHSIVNLPDEPRMLDAVRAGLSWADHARFAVSFTRCSGLQLIVDDLREMADRGGTVKLLTSTYQQVTQPDALEALLDFPNVECRVQDGPTGFHTKFFWFGGGRGAECWAGSSNLTKGGFATNLEWNIRATDEARLSRTQKQFETLWMRPDVKPLTPAFVASYRAVYREPAPVFVPGVERSGPQLVVPNAAQKEALAKLAQLRREGARRAAIIAATGVGKTFLAAFDVLQAKASRVLYVSHRLEHLTQAYRSFARVMREDQLGIVGGGRDQRNAPIVFATVASLRNSPDLLERPWDYLVIDEFHHAEAPSYQPLRSIVDRSFLLGITATPERQDGHDVLAWCDWNVAYEVRLPEAIDRGWLLPFHYFGIADETVDFARIPWRRLGGFKVEELERELSIEARADLILREARARGFDGPKRATVGFCAGVFHARFMADAFRRRNEHAVAVTGELSVEEREAIYQQFADPDHPLRWLFVSDVLNEGVDIPAINSVLFLRPTESASLFLQQLGRGLGLCKGTEVLTVLDFVGHERSAWLTLHAMHDPKGTGARLDVGSFTLKPPRACEVVLQPRTFEILSKIRKFAPTRRERCSRAYLEVREQLGRPPLPIDLFQKEEAPSLPDFRSAFGDWLGCQKAHGEEPAWAKGLGEEHALRLLLSAAEKNWQAQRVGAYALLWGLCSSAEPESGYRAFFERFPHWKPELTPLGGAQWETLRKKVPASVFEGDALARSIRAVGGVDLRTEIEGRLLVAINRDFEDRHGGVLRTPEELVRYGSYERPEIVRHFGVQYDPAKHNGGILWFGNAGVIITKLDTSGAIDRHQYANDFANERTFIWSSQNRMSQTNDAGLRVLDHSARGIDLHLFVMPRSHEPARYLGRVAVDRKEVTGNGPMRVPLQLEPPVPDAVLRELKGPGGDSADASE